MIERHLHLKFDSVMQIVTQKLSVASFGIFENDLFHKSFFFRCKYRVIYKVLCTFCSKRICTTTNLKFV